METADTQHIETLLHELFDDDSGNQQQHSGPHPPIEGLTRLPGFLNQQQQELLLQHVDATGWFSAAASPHLACSTANNTSTDRDNNCSSSTGTRGRSNQAMVFGVSNMPQWLQQLAGQLPLQQHWPAELANRSPPFDTAIINLYYPGDGITPHVDLLRFADGIAIVSLGDAAIMNFTPDNCEFQHEVHDFTPIDNEAQGELHWQHCDGKQNKQQEQLEQQQQHCQSVQQDCSAACQQTHPHQQQHNCCQQQQQQQQQRNCCEQKRQALQIQQQRPLQHQLLLHGGDVLLLYGAARYRWQHGIAAVAEEVLLCGSCQAAAAAAAAAGPAHEQSSATPAGDSTCASHSSMQPSVFVRQQEADDNCGAEQAAAGGADGLQVQPAACCACVRVVRGRRVSLTLRRLDPAQNMLDMQ
uniref:Alpha-ketoglutarate-dependent dioxygenase AlkB-like domain-containing protein n=1 Tax=Tetradesmus obliquus TaxID=3088 RepID=A0A383VZM1_TETOB|eukprot:jgi/Sobl393_1/4751/SZX70323.1